ncbi:MAG TPA: type I pullulanase [Clostridiales bacterium UBA8960]|nr:type I pullulanase [Clostridiales bacterium UBA8960]
MKKTLSMILILFLLVGTMPIFELSSASAVVEALEVVIHYHRFDGNYEGWNLWIWAKGKDGSSFEFNTEDAYGKKAEIRLEALGDAEEIGFIIRKGEWEAKDVESDRFVPIDKVNEAGQLEIYLVQGAERIYCSEDEIDLSPKFLKATFIDEKAVKVETSKPISSADLREKFTVNGENGDVIKPTAISSGVSDIAQNFVILLEKSVTVGVPYRTSYIDYEAIPIETSGLYDTEAFKRAYTYDGDLGAIYSKDKTVFRVWSPVATAMMLNLYEKGNGGVKSKAVQMSNIGKGVWEATELGDLHGVYYTYTVSISDKQTETYDPYAKAAGVNGDRSMVVDFEKTNPENWDSDKGPVYKKSNDIIVYEMHIRDLSTHPSANIKNVGKYLGVVETGTKTNENGLTTGLDHIIELGVTHVQILPMYDYNSVDETRLDENIFNWGYDPKNYSVPEGSYATDPYNGEVRINEMKQMIKGLHDSGIGVIMDVVYNHTALSADSNLSILAPNYYYRMVDGKYSNASGTGNETASERDMVRKLMIDSLKFWVTEYHIDGFRFDLMGVHDTETMRLIDLELRKINPDIIIYGEGWTGGSSPLAESKRLVKANILDVERIGAFNDDFRDGIKGHVFNAKEAGFANGAPGFEESVKFGIVGAVFHPGVNYKLVNYSSKPWANQPSQSVNYVSAHDNLTLWDKLMHSKPLFISRFRVCFHQFVP